MMYAVFIHLNQMLTHFSQLSSKAQNDRGKDNSIKLYYHKDIGIRCTFNQKSIVLMGIAAFQVYPFYFFQLSVFDLLELFESMNLPQYGCLWGWSPHMNPQVKASLRHAYAIQYVAGCHISCGEVLISCHFSLLSISTQLHFYSSLFLSSSLSFSFFIIGRQAGLPTSIAYSCLLNTHCM